MEKILVKRLEVGDKVVIRHDLSSDMDYLTYSGIICDMKEYAGKEAIIEGVIMSSDEENIQCFILNVDNGQFTWNINMFESINREKNIYIDVCTDIYNEDFIPIELL